MKWSTNLLGGLLLLLGVTGILVCVAAIVVTWKVRNRLDHTVAKTFHSVDSALTRLEDRTQRTNEQIASVQESLHELNDRVQQRIADLQGVPKADAPDIDAVERRVVARFQQVQAWVELMQSTVELIEQLVEMSQSAFAFWQDNTRTTQDLLAALRAGREGVAETSKLLEEVKAELIEVKARRDVETHAKQIRTLTSRIDAALAKVQGYGQKFEAGVAQARTSIADIAARLRWKFTLAAIVGTLLFLWMGAGQLAIAVRGRRMFSPH